MRLPCPITQNSDIFAYKSLSKKSLIILNAILIDKPQKEKFLFRFVKKISCFHKNRTTLCLIKK
jgi:hypothetical protein